MWEGPGETGVSRGRPGLPGHRHRSWHPCPGGTYNRHFARDPARGGVMFSGSIVALVTPFKDQKVDFQKLEELVHRHIESGTNGIVPCGTTGESATLSHEEHEEVIAAVVRAA